MMWFWQVGLYSPNLSALLKQNARVCLFQNKKSEQLQPDAETIDVTRLFI